jgi:serine/threonine protein kinase
MELAALPGAEEGAARSGRPLDGSVDADRWDFEAGDEIAPGRHVLSRLGGGSRYEAYLAWDEHLHTTVVVKVVRPGRVEDAETRAELTAEANALASLSHPVIVRGFGAVLDGTRPHLLLEHLEGPRLSSLIRREGALGLEQLAPLAVQLCAALHYMHAEGWVHLDVKPANVIMGAPPRLIDLSIARRADAARRLRIPVGTDSYMPPEQCAPGERGEVGPAADVFAVGVTLFRAATGERPFTPGDPDAQEPGARWPQLAEEPALLDGRIPGEAGRMVEAALAASPADRPAPAEIAAAFTKAVAKLPKPRLGRLKPRWS